MKIKGIKMRMTQLFKEHRALGVTPIKVGVSENLETVKIGGFVHVSGTTKGKGFQGVVKRHGFAGGPKTHGQKNRYRAPGSIGNTTPQRVLPGRRMAGHMGVVRRTIKNLEVVSIDADKKILFILGAAPGPVRGKVTVTVEG